jgi:exopolyphosphatase / guanosine-5'-triphosphate,3'-diphosphate pyrophosphatase
VGAGPFVHEWLAVGPKVFNREPWFFKVWFMTTFRTSERCALIDVGTNSVKLLVADMNPTLKPLLKLSRQTRLGQNAFRTGRLQPEAIARTVVAVAELVSKASKLRPTSLRILATSAAREAANGFAIVQAISRATGLAVEVISGEQEAEYVFRGVTTHRMIGRRPVLIVDVGGGSTEWVVGESGFIYFTQSTRLGTTRLLGLLSPSDPPTPEDLERCRATVDGFLRQEVQPRLRAVLASFCGRPVSLVGLGGALKTLARLADAPKPRDEAPILLRAGPMRQQVERLWRLASEKRRHLVGLDPQKADVILAGAVIYEAVMRLFQFPQLLVSSQGLRHGALMSRPSAGILLGQKSAPKLTASVYTPAWSRPPEPSTAVLHRV